MWISPVRDLAAKDLALVAHFHRLGTVASPPVLPARSQGSINGLAERFIAGLQLGMPSTVHAVLGTACKLQVCSFSTPSLLLSPCCAYTCPVVATSLSLSFSCLWS